MVVIICCGFVLSMPCHMGDVMWLFCWYIDGCQEIVLCRFLLLDILVYSCWSNFGTFEKYSAILSFLCRLSKDAYDDSDVNLTQVSAHVPNFELHLPMLLSTSDQRVRAKTKG